MSDPDAAASVLAERPDLEGPLEAVLEVDEERGTWTFEDVPIDSGPFGELVSRGIVDPVGDEYRLADPDEVRAALAGDDDTSETTAPSTPALSSLARPDVDRTTALLVAAAVAFVGLMRVYPVGSIYRNGDLVLSGNDPYAYRYHLERVLEGVQDGAVVPDGVPNGEPLYVATMGWLSKLLGGMDAAGHVLAWYPVVAAVVGAGIVYVLAVRVTGDRRVGAAAVLFLALIPGHALRTSIGYADHHAFDYLWLGLTALAVTWLADVDRAGLRSSRTWGLVAGLGTAVTGQIHSWDAGPLLVAPIGLVVAGRAAVAVRRGDSPVPTGAPLVLGLALGGGLAIVLHELAGFQSTVVAMAPAVLAAGSAAALGIATAAHRLEWGLRRVVAGYVAMAIAGLAVLNVVLTPLWETFLDRLDFLFRGDAIAETQGLFNTESFGFIFLFGFTLFLALPAMAVGLRRSIDDGRWLAVTTYAWYFFALATIQVRFVGELATFAAIFAGYGFVWTAAWIEAIPLTRRVGDELAPLRIPNRRVLATVFALMLLFASFGALQVGVKTSQVVIDDDVYESAAFIADRAEERDQGYPENYVLSDWGRNRVYNYFVSGESGGYGYAQNNYGEFAGATDPDSWYGQFEGRVGYVVLGRATDGTGPRSAIWKLTRNYGSADGNVRGVGHYRALYVAENGGRTVVAVVPGANVTGSGEAGTAVNVSTAVDTGSLQFEYERRTEVTESGDWSVRVAQPGTYAVSVGNETVDVSVSEAAVEQGERVTVE